MKKRVSFVQPNFQQGPKEFNAYYLPYSAGVILSYALSHEPVQKAWELGDLIWRREPIEETAQRLQHDDVVAFSTYVWNHRYNYKLARRIKELNPRVKILFGGPEPAITDPKLFEKGLNMVIMEMQSKDITDSIDLICPTNTYSKTKFDIIIKIKNTNFKFR